MNGELFGMVFKDFGMLAIIHEDNRKFASSMPIRCHDCGLCLCY